MGTLQAVESCILLVGLAHNYSLMRGSVSTLHLLVWLYRMWSGGYRVHGFEQKVHGFRVTGYEVHTFAMPL